MKSYDVRIWQIRPVKRMDKKSGRERVVSYEVRWRVAVDSKSKSFAQRAQADSFRSDLVQAARKGEAFDTLSGLPESLARQRQSTRWIDHAVEYAQTKWPRASAKHRASIAETLATVTPVLVRGTRGMPPPDEMRRALYGWAFNSESRKSSPDASVDRCMEWLRKNSLHVRDLDDPKVIRSALDALTVKLDGKTAAASTIYRKRASLYNCLRYAVELRLLTSNPIDTVQWSPPDHDDGDVDPRVVVNPQQARALINAIGRDGEGGRRLKAFFACLYYAGMRPGEVTALRRDGCHLPAEGWGVLRFGRSEPRAGSRWTDDGTIRDRRGLKHRSRRAERIVPIPPHLVELLREYLAAFGTDQDGRLFRGARDGGDLAETVYGRAWKRARVAVLTADQVATPLAARPYDLRHAAVSLWLNAGVPATEVAERAGHSVAVLLKVYAACVDGQADVANAKIEAALAA
ncbi:tyrosine-type recombinase/integrase [Actinoalloteichus sp. GBA129-24]|uniref:tyrosine-type recombinase/integrase n=1 Tax=Actinoalloteichus sp. GBA129-24 TaxID=1612551 RepID=UPI000950637A|nr:site-specific integrase [Actinoalloteichus sp. GBA129-24]APU18612.1 site-specific recombinase XerD [Actinoalloteichus sp. GBA129-24]